jgi:peptide methionine sulfoxide reductase MsrA
MGLPDNVAIKLNTYTLYCRQLLKHLQALNKATDLRLTIDHCRRRFDELLHQFFYEAAPRDLEQAVNDLGAALRGRVGYFRGQNPQAAAVFDQVVEAAVAATPTWRYQEDLEAFHQQGRQLARHFYADSPRHVTQDRLSREARLVFLYGYGEEIERPNYPTRRGASSRGRQRPNRERRRTDKEFGYCPVPLAFRERYLDEETDQWMEDVILVYFEFDRDFGLYLAYPYLFMHEYVAHIFALDHDNVLFDDGWMLHAADAFLRRRGWDLDLQPPLACEQEQIAVFGEFLLHGRLNRNPWRACCFAQRFYAWLDDPERFQAMTWELAAFERQEGESHSWPDQFINRLEQEFNANRPRLQRKIEAAPDVRALFEMLPPE